MTESRSPAPYLSVVATARNDNHGGDLLRRMQVFVNALDGQCERFAVDAELVLVEWNPPQDRAPLAKALDWPPAGSRLQVRIVQVPSEVHDMLDHSDRLSLFQMIAKNVGIRRARGRFVLATNVDVLLSDELVGSLANGRLLAGRLYRADRHDVAGDVDPTAPVQEQLAICAATVVLRCRLEGTDDLRTGEYYSIYGPLTHWPGPLARWGRLFRMGLPLAIRRLRVLGRAGIARLVRTRRRTRGDGQSGGGTGLAKVGTIFRDTWRDARAFHTVMQERWEREKMRVRLHTNACGDFTLLMRDDWFALRGYAEFQLFSMHLDSLLVYEAHYAGLKQVVLPGAVYHLEHSGGWRPDPAAVRSLNDRLDRAAIPQIQEEQFHTWLRELYIKRAPLVFNTEDWGFAGREFEETIPARTAREEAAAS